MKTKILLPALVFGLATLTTSAQDTGGGPRRHVGAPARDDSRTNQERFDPRQEDDREPAGPRQKAPPGAVTPKSPDRPDAGPDFRPPPIRPPHRPFRGDIETRVAQGEPRHRPAICPHCGQPMPANGASARIDRRERGPWDGEPESRMGPPPAGEPGMVPPFHRPGFGPKTQRGGYPEFAPEPPGPGFGRPGDRLAPGDSPPRHGRYARRDDGFGPGRMERPGPGPRWDGRPPRSEGPRDFRSPPGAELYHQGTAPGPEAVSGPEFGQDVPPGPPLHHREFASSAPAPTPEDEH